jgi:hypothetical protein
MNSYTIGKYDPTTYVISEYINILIDPDPLPFNKYNRTTEKKLCVPASDAPGNTRVWDAGSGDGSDTLTLNFKYCSATEVLALENIFKSMSEVAVIDTKLDRTYECAWEGGNSCDINAYSGSVTLFTATLQFAILGEVNASFTYNPPLEEE